MSKKPRELILDSLKEQLAVEIFAVINELNKDCGLDQKSVFEYLEFPQDLSKGDYAFPCFRLAKTFRKKPDLIAEDIQAGLEKKECQIIKSINSISGFLNISIDKTHLAKTLFPKIKDGSLFDLKSLGSAANSDKKVMVEYSQPNTHKEFHVGHGRNVCLGDSIYRLYKYLGFETLGVNYIGDEGTHIAKCLFAVLKNREAMPENGRAVWLGSMYVESTKILDQATESEKIEIEKEISSILAAIESKEGEIYKLWQETREDCLNDFNKIYDWLDVKFDHFFYESEVSEPAQKVVDHYLEKGIFYEDQGAIGLDMSDQKLGFFMARKSDGNSPYITKDIALAEEKFRDFNIDFNVYVVGKEQEFHFNQLFNFLKIAKFENADKCYHLSYGHVKRPEGKMSSRLGNSFTFNDLTSLVNEKVAENLEKYQGDWSKSEIEETQRKLSVGAIKYGMLSSDPKKDIVFEPDNWIRFDGNSGPYLMYSYSRCQSILAKGKDQGLSPSMDNLNLLSHEIEGDLIFYLYKFNIMVNVALENLKPSVLCHYLYELAKTFSQFYVQVPVLKEGTNEEKEARLSLIESYSVVLKKGLELIGITPPAKM